jgi:hypothetical protein
MDGSSKKLHWATPLLYGDPTEGNKILNAWKDQVAHRFAAGTVRTENFKDAHILDRFLLFPRILPKSSQQTRVPWINKLTWVQHG